MSIKMFFIYFLKCLLTNIYLFPSVFFTQGNIENTIICVFRVLFIYLPISFIANE